MRMKNTFSKALVLGVAGIVMLMGGGCKNTPVEVVCTTEEKPVCADVAAEECAQANCPVTKSTFTNRCLAEKAGAKNIQEGACKPAPNDSTMLKIDWPLKDNYITSPVTVRGQARGPWFSEGSFPVDITDAAGKSLGKGTVKAQGEWMTNDFVNFSGQVTFKKGTAKEGFVVFRRDNPSGNPENDKDLKIPVKF